MTKTKILFIGCVKFSKRSLEKLIKLGANIVGVCTRESSDFNADFTNLQKVCKRNNLIYRYETDINSDENIKWIKNLNPDIIFCFGWSSLIKKELLSIPPMGVLGYHPTKLPKNRGRHPLIWTLVMGITKSASTFFFMNEGADEGNILSQKEFSIDYLDDAKTLYKKVTKIALSQINDFYPLILKNNFTLIKQDNSDSNIWRKRSKNDGKIDFRMSSFAIYNLVRALTSPYSGAHLVYKGKEVKIWKVKEKKTNETNIECGKVLNNEDGNITIKTYDGAIVLLEHEFETLPNKGEYL